MFFYRTIVLLLVFSQYLRNYKLPLPIYRFWPLLHHRQTTTNANQTHNYDDHKKRRWIIKRFDIFTLLPVIITFLNLINSSPNC